MILGCIFGAMGCGVHKLQLYLQGSIPQNAAQLRFGCDLGGHQIQKHDLKGADILGSCPIFRHHKYILALQHLSGRQVIGDLNGHGKFSLPWNLGYSTLKLRLCQLLPR
jgi:hypothetical protein